MSTSKTETPTSLQEMNQLAEDIAVLRDQEKEASEAKAVISKSLEEKEARVLELLIENELTSYKAPEGTLSVSSRLSARLPQGEERAKFYEFLKSTGKFDEMISVNSQTLNGYVKEQYELAQEQGADEPKIPGISEVKMIPRLSFRRTR